MQLISIQNKNNLKVNRRVSFLLKLTTYFYYSHLFNYFLKIKTLLLIKEKY